MHAISPYEYEISSKSVQFVLMKMLLLMNEESTLLVNTHRLATYKYT